MTDCEYQDCLLQKLRASGLKNCEWIAEHRITSPFIRSFFIADIASPTLGIVIEIDGWYHNSRRQFMKDLQRTALLNQSGWWVARVKPDADFANLFDLCLEIGSFIGHMQSGIGAAEYHQQLLNDLRLAA